MLGFQGSTSSSKVYRCVACSATFTGLASLLVHQATHAGAVAKVSAPPQHSISPHETPCSSVDASNENTAAATPLPQSPSASYYICDCGEEFQDLSLMSEHKRSHVCQLRLLPNSDDNSAHQGTRQALSTQQVSLSPTVTQSDVDLSHPSTSGSPAVELRTLTDHKADMNPEDRVAMVTSHQVQSPLPQGDDVKQPEIMSDTAEQLPETENMHFQDETNSDFSHENGEVLPRKKDLMKLLASAYMNRFKSPLSSSLDNDTINAKQEVEPVDITQGAEVSHNNLSVAQLRLLATPSMKTKSPSISRVLDSSRKKIVPLTKTFSPVVVLETRQKLKDPNGIGNYGRYQCGRCRKVFQNVDRLTEHHFLHKKERIKCCRHCKQLIIGRVPLPDNHVCTSEAMSRSFKSKLPISQKLVPFHSLCSTRKVFFCPLCKHSYARRWNLKNHKCHGTGAVSPQGTSFSFQKMLLLRSNRKAKTNAEMEAVSQDPIGVSVDTQVDQYVKKEVISLNSEQSAPSELGCVRPAKRLSFSDFSLVEQHKDSSMYGASLQQEKENSTWDAAAVDNQACKEGKWTMPLDDEMEVISSGEKTDNGREVSSSVSHKNEALVPPGLRYFVRDGVKRYPCNRCQKTYSRPCTLRRHLRLCGFRPRGLGGVTSSGSHSGSTPNVTMFPCYVCGKTFNRKDNMITHRNKCELRQTMANADREAAQQGASGDATDCQPQEKDVSNWGIMSLPSVLPRRVTCECGAGFTSPSLLLEHLQKHAQESYTCPTCGETVNSWADYEVHLQIHMHPRHQLLKGTQPQGSQPLLLRFEQQRPSRRVPPQKQPGRGVHFSHQTRKKQRIVCSRCGNTFATRCSLKRHLSCNRCKGVQAANPPTHPPKAYHCSHCNSNFPNTISLLFHQRSGACKPAIKPVRCPVCLRWFGTVDGLQKHLLTHKQTETYRCDVCHGKYPNLKSLKNHRRRIHRILVGSTQSKIQEELTS